MACWPPGLLLGQFFVTMFSSIADDLHLPSVTITNVFSVRTNSFSLLSLLTSYLHGGRFRTLLSCYYCVEVSTRNSKCATPGNTMLHVSIISWTSVALRQPMLCICVQ